MNTSEVAITLLVVRLIMSQENWTSSESVYRPDTTNRNQNLNPILAPVILITADLLICLRISWLILLLSGLCEKSAKTGSEIMMIERFIKCDNDDLGGGGGRGCPGMILVVITK